VDDARVRAEVAALEELLESIEPRGAEAVAALLRVYGEALRRIVEALRDAPDIADALANDELVSHLLALHDLLPAQERAVAPDIVFGPVVLS